MLIPDVFQVLEKRRIKVGNGFPLDLVTVLDLAYLVSCLHVTLLHIMQIPDKSSQLLSAFGRGSRSLLDPPWRPGRNHPLYLETVAGQVGCTFAAVVQTFPVDGDLELCLSLAMVDAGEGLDRHFPFGNGAAIADRQFVAARGDCDLLFLMIFVILVGSVGWKNVIFLIDISLPDGRVVNLIFSGYISGQSLEERVLI